MTAIGIAAAAFLLMLPHRADGQVRRADLNLALYQLQTAVDALSPVVKPPRLIEAVGWLAGRSAATNPADVSEEYLRSLQSAASLLRQRPTGDVIADVTADLDAKMEHCRLLGIGMGGSVLVRVNTRRGPQMVGDWQVQYLLKIYERVAGSSPGSFPALSTPTEFKLDPGRYVLWARDPGTGRMSERTTIRVIGQAAVTVDLPVP